MARARLRRYGIVIGVTISKEGGFLRSLQPSAAKSFPRRRAVLYMPFVVIHIK
jgi:hypothetical protein